MLLWIKFPHIQEEKRRYKMFRLLLVLFPLLCVNVLACEERDPALTGESRIHTVSIYPPLAQDALEKIYDPKKEAHCVSIVRREDLPLCLQRIDGPLPFYGHSGDARLPFLRSDYFASLHFDQEAVQEEAASIRQEATRLKRKNPTEALKLLYKAGWGMGDPLSVKMLVDLIVELRSKDESFIRNSSNIILVLNTYPKTMAAVIKTIKACRRAIDQRTRSSSSEAFELSCDDEGVHIFGTTSEESKASLLGVDKQTGLRRRGK